MSFSSRFWNRMYLGTPAWELGEADPLLVSALDDRRIQGPGRALDVGCGTGDNAIELARRGFEVTAVDIADRPLSTARAKARDVGAEVDFRLADVTRCGGTGGAFDLIVDRGLLMSLFGERARARYVSALDRLTADGGCHYQYQWGLAEDPRVLTPEWMATRVKGFVIAPGEIEARFADAYVVEQLHRSVEPTDDRGLRRMGIRQVAKLSYWLRRRAGADPA